MTDQLPGQIELEEYLRSIDRENFNILEHIPTGSENAIERSALRIKTSLDDRSMRNLIHFARRTMPILNLQDGRGYFIPDMNHEKDVRLLVKYVLQEESRLKNIGWSLLAARRTLKNCGVDYRSERRR